MGGITTRPASRFRAGCTRTGLDSGRGLRGTRIVGDGLVRPTLVVVDKCQVVADSRAPKSEKRVCSTRDWLRVSA